MMGAVESIPILMASAPMSDSTASIWRATNSGATLSTPWTPSEFWAVNAVIAEVPKTRNAENVLRSAWMPAPPPESEPAMVSAVGTVISWQYTCPAPARQTRLDALVTRGLLCGER